MRWNVRAWAFEKKRKKSRYLSFKSLHPANYTYTGGRGLIQYSGLSSCLGWSVSVRSPIESEINVTVLYTNDRLSLAQ